MSMPKTTINTNPFFLRKKFVIISLGCSLLVGGYSFYTGPSQKYKTDLYVSHNVAGIQTNPLEYRSTMKQIQKTTNDPKLRQVLDKILALDQDRYIGTKKEKKQRVTITLQEVSKLLSVSKRGDQTGSFISSFDIEAGCKRLEEKKQMKSITDLFIKMKAGLIDKSLRELGESYPSIYYGFSDELMAFCSAHKKFNPEAFATLWDRDMSTYDELLYTQLKEKKGITKEEYVEYRIMLFWIALSDMYRLYEEKEAFLYYMDAMKRTALGDEQIRHKKFAQLYQNAHFLLLQEADEHLVHYLCSEQPFAIAGKVNTKSDFGSVILYHKEKTSFKNGNMKLLTLSDGIIAEAQKRVPNVSKKNIAKLQSREMAICLIEEEKEKPLLLVSFHAATDGSNTLLAIESISLLHAQLEKELGQSIFLIIGMDSNTTDRPSKKLKKLDLTLLKRFLDEKENLQLITYKEADLSTVNKERSTFQLQLDKAHIANQGISDLWLTTDDVDIKITAKWLSPHGPNIEKNPSDHRALFMWVRRTTTIQKKVV